MRSKCTYDTNGKSNLISSYWQQSPGSAGRAGRGRADSRHDLIYKSLNQKPDHLNEHVSTQTRTPKNTMLCHTQLRKGTRNYCPLPLLGTSDPSVSTALPLSDPRFPLSARPHPARTWASFYLRNVLGILSREWVIRCHTGKGFNVI